MTDGSHRRVGVLLAHFNDSFQRQLWRAVRHRAREKNASTVAFLGHGLQEPQLRHRTSTALYQLARAPLLDGLVVFSQNIGTHSGPEAVSALIDNLGLPAVSVGFDLPGIPSIRSLGDQAVRDLVAHLVTVHGRRQFVLFTGPRQQPESLARERAVHAELTAQGIGIDPLRVVDAEFSREKAWQEAETLFSSGIEVDAVVCLNDHMAVGVVEYLTSRKIRVPEDVSVVGFDDLPESQWRRPSLSTARQPLELMGFWAVDRLLETPLRGASAVDELECDAIFRRSCGCSMAPRVVSEQEVENSLEQSDRFARLREIGVSLQGAFGWDSLASQWALAVETLGFQAGEVVIYRGPLHDKFQWTKAEGLCRSDDLEGPLTLPGAPGGPTDWVVLPLVYQDEFLGYTVLSCDLDDALVYETLRDQMATAVKATALMEASFHHQQELEHQVERRTKELRIANLSLTEQIRQRKELEKAVQEISNQTMQSIGQDIHDDLCQHLAGIGMLASVLEETWEAQASDPLRSVREIRNLLEKAVDRARQYSRSLYPPSLDQHGLVAALGELVDSFRQTAGSIELALQVEGASFVTDVTDPQVRLQLYRIAQELIANAIKHSGSELVLIRLVSQDEQWVLEVRDFGKGLAETIAPNRMGMKILHYRADSAGASLVFQNIDPGLRVSCRVPKVAVHR